MNISEFENKQVFIIGTDSDCDVGNIAVFEKFEDLNDQLINLSPISDMDVIVLHGIITSSKYIPEGIGDHVYLIEQEVNDPQTAAIHQLTETTSSELAFRIEQMVAKQYGCVCNETSIDNIFIVYGYELNLGYGISKEELDEELIESCSITASFIDSNIKENKKDPFLDDYDIEQHPMYQSFVNVL